MKAGRDILSEYGRDSSSPKHPSATSGGVTQAKPTTYKPPVGPSNINDPKGPGLHGHNCGNTHQPTGSDRPSGSPGLHGSNRGNQGSQR